MQLKLSNGLTLVSECIPQSSIVSVQAWMQVGSAQEITGEEGMAHFFEHMIFKGTKKRKVGEIAQSIESRGGDINAYTSFDQTVYHITISSRHINLALEILADAIQNSSFDKQEIEREKLVVFEEMKRSHDNPRDIAGEHLFKTVFTTHPYRNPILGSEKTVGNLTQDKLFAFHRKWYRPKHTTLIVTGNFQEDRLVETVKELFPDSSSHSQDKNTANASEPLQSEPRMAFTNFNTHLSHYHLGFPIPGIKHEDIPVLEVLASVLGQGDSSRLFQALKSERRLVTAIHSGLFSLKDAGIFLVSSILDSSYEKKMLAVVKDEIDKIKNELIQTSELQRVKINIESESIFEKETSDGVAKKLGFYSTYFGDLKYEEEYLNSIRRTSPQDVQKVAQKYLDFSRLNCIGVVPASKKALSQESVQEIFSLKLSSQSIVHSAQAGVQKQNAAKPTIIKLRGAIIVSLKDERLPLLTLRASLLGGSRAETPQTQGLSNFYSRMLTLGTQSRDKLTIAQEVEDMAGRLEGYSGRNSLGLSFEFLSQFETRAMSLFFDVLKNPGFREIDIKNEKSQMLEEIAYEEDQMSSVCYKNFLKSLYGKHPYAYSVLGEKNSISKLNRQKLIDFHQSRITPSNLVIGLVGNFSNSALRQIEHHLESLERHKTASITLPPIKKIKSRTIGHVEKTKKQAHIILGFLGARIKSPDRFALHILSTLLSGQSGTLFLKLRDQLGLAYSIYASNVEGLEEGHFYIYMGTSPERAFEALEKLKEELLAILDGKITDDEIERSKQYIIGLFEVSPQKLMSRNAFYSFDILYSLGLSETFNYAKNIQKITKEQVLKTARKYIDLGHAHLSIAGPVNKPR
ncbi:MAG: insulinase family protein [Deltaproteobacteria bacterium]|nr:insulinase family protein [Deltaproteobacteria bacterium]